MKVFIDEKRDIKFSVSFLIISRKQIDERLKISDMRFATKRQFFTNFIPKLLMNHFK